jgi:hypothetical protein
LEKIEDTTYSLLSSVNLKYVRVLQGVINTHFLDIVKSEISKVLLLLNINVCQTDNGLVNRESLDYGFSGFRQKRSKRRVVFESLRIADGDFFVFDNFSIDFLSIFNYIVERIVFGFFLRVLQGVDDIESFLEDHILEVDFLNEES